MSYSIQASHPDPSPATSTRVYVRTAQVMTGVIALVAQWKNPYGADFARLVVPATLLLTSIQSLLLPLPRYQQLGLSLIFLTTSELLLRSLLRSVVAYLVVIAVVLIYTALICVVAPDAKSKSRSIAQSFTVTFILLVGQYLQNQNVQPRWIESERLFCLPLVMMVLWIAASPSGWNSAAKSSFVVGLLQITMGFWDIGMREHLAPMVTSAGIALLLAIACPIYWWLAPSKSDPGNQSDVKRDSALTPLSES